MQKILVTGFAGFIGYSLVNQLREKFSVTALDNFSRLSNYNIKKARAAELGIKNFSDFENTGSFQSANVTLHHADICKPEQLEKIISNESFDCVIHLAALTGVRPSLQNPQAYIDANVTGFINIAEACQKAGVKNIIYASSSSVYGLNQQTPYTENTCTDLPISVYAASKKTNELLAHTYAHLYSMNFIGLRFFTVYGPWTRPDMAAYLFMDAINHNKPISLFNEGKMIRDFTYINDVVQSIALLIEKIRTQKPGVHQIFNVGNHQPIYISDFLQSIEHSMNKKAIVDYKPIQAGDMLATSASCEKLFDYTGYKPHTEVHTGVQQMVDWYLKNENKR